MAELAELHAPRIRAANSAHGDDHGVSLTRLRAVANRLKRNQDLAVQLWRTDDSAARLLALLVCRPRAADLHPVVASAGWALTTDRVAKKPDGLDLACRSGSSTPNIGIGRSVSGNVWKC